MSTVRKLGIGDPIPEGTTTMGIPTVEVTEDGDTLLALGGKVIFDLGKVPAPFQFTVRRPNHTTDKDLDEALDSFKVLPPPAPLNPMNVWNPQICSTLGTERYKSAAQTLNVNKNEVNLPLGINRIREYIAREMSDLSNVNDPTVYEMKLAGLAQRVGYMILDTDYEAYPVKVWNFILEPIGYTYDRMVEAIKRDY